MPYTDWDLDTDVSLFMHKMAVIEKGITQVSQSVRAGISQSAKACGPTHNKGIKYPSLCPMLRVL